MPEVLTGRGCEYLWTVNGVGSRKIIMTCDDFARYAKQITSYVDTKVTGISLALALGPRRLITDGVLCESRK